MTTKFTNNGDSGSGGETRMYVRCPDADQKDGCKYTTLQSGHLLRP